MFCLPCRTAVIGCWTALWESGCPRNKSSAQTSPCLKCCCGWCCLVSLLNWSLACLSSSSPSFTGSMKDSAAQLPASPENWALILSSIRTVSLCWALSLQSSWRERWVTDHWLTDELLVICTFISNNQIVCLFRIVNFIQERAGTMSIYYFCITH